MPELSSIFQISKLSAAIPIIMGMNGMFSFLNDGCEDNVFFGQSIDPIYKYYKFESHYNQILDKLLMDANRGCVGNRILISKNSYVPGNGRHYYYCVVPHWFRAMFCLDSCNRLVFYKRIKKNNNGNDDITYYCYVSPLLQLFKNNIFEEIKEQIYKPKNGMMYINSIDGSTIEPKIIVKAEICKKATLAQKKIADHVLKHYFDKKNNHNVVIFISGLRGTKKTYTGKIIKNMLENHLLSECKIRASLVDNFNPKTIGVNIQSFILCNASEYSPCITMMNEFDISMNHAISDKQDYDPRMYHAKDKESLNDMLDNIKNSTYTITIFTSEFSARVLQNKNPDFRSFLRHGRMDYYAHMADNEDDCTIIEANKN